MDITSEIENIIGNNESEKLAYKAVLLVSKSLARLVCSFANTSGGHIILGVSENKEVNGLSEDFRANSITHKALDILSPVPDVHYQYVTYQGKRLYVIKIKKSESEILFEGNAYIRIGDKTQLKTQPHLLFSPNVYEKIPEINTLIVGYSQTGTNSKQRVSEHFQSILKLIDDLASILYPNGANVPTDNQEGKILSRILFSSYVDSFEAYLSDLLYEIFLANPASLKSQQNVTIEEVLNCSDMQEFIEYWSKLKISKLQKGSVKGFIKENKQIKDLNVIDETEMSEIERILQIRHLYAHRNGIVDEKFLQFFSGQYALNSEHRISIQEFCVKLLYLIEIIEKIDNSAKNKYNLATIS
nr:ATP-binding protein [uncultured Carboxylicivirga sp.]